MPDFGTGQSINTAQRKTATEVEQIGQLMNQNVDLRARVFRKALGMLYRQAWALLLQYDGDFQYVYDGELTGINPDALHGEYMIAPNGSSDSWNRQVQLQKAVARKQLLGQSPYINQEELDRSILELDDPRLIKRLFVDPEQKIQDQAERQARETPTLADGFQITPKPDDDHAVHIRTTMQYMETHHPLTPVDQQTHEAHIALHQQALAGNGAGRDASPRRPGSEAQLRRQGRSQVQLRNEGEGRK